MSRIFLRYSIFLTFDPERCPKYVTMFWKFQGFSCDHVGASIECRCWGICQVSAVKPNRLVRNVAVFLYFGSKSRAPSFAFSHWADIFQDVLHSLTLFTFHLFLDRIYIYCDNLLLHIKIFKCLHLLRIDVTSSGWKCWLVVIR